MTATTMPARPLAVRVLRATGWIATVTGAATAIPSFAVGASTGFGDLARVWVALATIGVILLLAGVTALLAAHPSPAGLGSGLVACTLLLILLPVGTAVTVAVGLIASQSWPQLRDYYGLTRRAS